MASFVEGYRRRVAPLATKVLGNTDTPLTRTGGELGRLAADAEREFAHTDAAVVSPGAVRADVQPGPITYGEVAEALAYDHPVVRTELTGRELQAFAADVGFYSGPSELDPEQTYSVASSEMLLPHGRPVGTEVEALAWYLNR
jgi:2',3'-cyclic-nucleotide 2'-phosphodiesterase (5'-nucleotidase family)